MIRLRRSAEQKAILAERDTAVAYNAIDEYLHEALRPVPHAPSDQHGERINAIRSSLATFDSSFGGAAGSVPASGLQVFVCAPGGSRCEFSRDSVSRVLMSSCADLGPVAQGPSVLLSNGYGNMATYVCHVLCCIVTVTCEFRASSLIYTPLVSYFECVAGGRP